MNGATIKINVDKFFANPSLTSQISHLVENHQRRESLVMVYQNLYSACKLTGRSVLPDKTLRIVSSFFFADLFEILVDTAIAVIDFGVQ